MMIVTVKEDLTHDVDFRIRLLGLTLSAIALIKFANDSLPVVDHIIVISDLFHNPAFSFAFFSLCLIALANGCNFIDGLTTTINYFQSIIKT
jgi:UDP-N-acetylmuramyl pentapeptide phosphotransferase/UDP-N-acetylglucosamine-1-phosphate transferase